MNFMEKIVNFHIQQNGSRSLQSSPLMLIFRLEIHFGLIQNYILEILIFHDFSGGQSLSLVKMAKIQTSSSSKFPKNQICEK